MVAPQRCESEQYEEKEIKSRESTRSKSHEFMRSDWMTLRRDTLGQVKSKSIQVPHHRRPEGAAIQQRPGASTSATLMEFPDESRALYSILACLFLWLLFAQGEAPSYIAAAVLALSTQSFPQHAPSHQSCCTPCGTLPRMLEVISSMT